jgi:hypothetical protein
MLLWKPVKALLDNRVIAACMPASKEDKYSIKSIT